MPVTAAFYPLQFVAERVGGDHVEVTTLTKPGTEPHDLELTPKAVGELAHAEAVVYLAGFQPAVDDAVRTQAGMPRSTSRGPRPHVTAPTTATTTPARPRRSTPSTPGRAPRTRTSGSTPRAWRPSRPPSASAFAAADPANAAAYRANADRAGGDLTTLDEEFTAGLATCESTELVTGHAAFGYLAARYGLGQEGIAGISPDAEPDAATLRELTEHVREDGVTTVYAETLVSPALAETLSRETGARVAVLDPLEGLTDASAGSDYLEVMRANLQTLREGQSCT